MPAALTSGFGPPSNASPSDENGAAPPSPSFASKAAAPTANATGIERRERRADGIRIGRRQPEDRHVGGAVGAERPCRQRPVDEHGARTGRDDLANGLGGRCSAREQHGRACDAAVAVAVEEAGETRRPRRPPPEPTARSATTGADTEIDGATTPPSGWTPETRTRSPASRRTWPVGLRRRVSIAPAVSAAGAPPGPPMLP